MEQNKPQPNQIQIKATDEKLKGEYSNVMQIMHTKEEFVMDFLNHRFSGTFQENGKSHG